MAPSDKKRRSGLIAAALFFGFGLLILFQAHYADVHHTMMPGYKGAWMYPWQGYLAAVVCFASAANGVYLALGKQTDIEEPAYELPLAPVTVEPAPANIFSFLGKHALGALAGIYVASVIAQLFWSIWPSARLPIFIIVSLIFVLAEISITVREVNKGRLSTGIILLDFLPFLLLGAGISLFLGHVAGQWWGSDWGGLIVFLGTYYCILLVIAGVKETVQNRNLEEDLKNPGPATTEKDRQKIRKYMHPYA